MAQYPSFQEILDTTVPAILKQGCKSTEGNAWPGGAKCLYRGPNNTKCAVGVLIPDNKYLEAMEDGDWTLERIVCRVYGGEPSNFIDGGSDLSLIVGFLSRLQQQHDCADDGDFVNSFRERARSMAHSYGLTWNPEWDDL